MNVVYALVYGAFLSIVYYQNAANEQPKSRQIYYCGPGTLSATFHGQDNQEVTIVDWRQRTFELPRDFTEKGRVFVNKSQRVSIEIKNLAASLTIIDRNFDA